MNRRAGRSDQAIDQAEAERLFAGGSVSPSGAALRAVLAAAAAPARAEELAGQETAVAAFRRVRSTPITIRPAVAAGPSTALGGTAPDRTTPDRTTPDGTTADRTTPDGTTADRTTPDGNTADGSTADGTGRGAAAPPRRPRGRAVLMPALLVDTDGPGGIPALCKEPASAPAPTGLPSTDRAGKSNPKV
jgi:hypothetical protein